MTKIGRSTELSQQARFREIWDAHHDAVATYCRRRASREDARDAVSETFVIAWSKLVDVPEGASARYWLYGVARRVLSNLARRGRRHARFLSRLKAMPRESIPPAEVLVLRNADAQRVVDAAARLRPIDREILYLAAWEELPHAAIGEVLGLRHAAVAQRLARAKRRLAAEFIRTSQPRDGAT